MPEKHGARVIMHNSVSLDGSFVGLDVLPEFMGLHYEIASRFGSAVRLIGSNTAKVSIEMFGGLAPETPADYARPSKPDGLTHWAIVDSKGILKDKLHYFRRSEYCRDVAVLAAGSTGRAYLDYLERRSYDYFVSGEDRVDLGRVVEWIACHYATTTILVDAGSALTNAMLDQGLIDEISLLVLPSLLGKKGRNLFEWVSCPIGLSLKQQQTFPGGFAWLSYDVKNPQ